MRAQYTEDFREEVDIGDDWVCEEIYCSLTFELESQVIYQNN